MMKEGEKYGYQSIEKEARRGDSFPAGEALSVEVDYINGPDTLPPPLTGEKEHECLEKLESGDVKARELLIVHNLRLVVYIAKKFESTGVQIEDLISIGTLGLSRRSIHSACQRISSSPPTPHAALRTRYSCICVRRIRPRLRCPISSR